MRGAVLYGPKDLRFEERETPAIIKPTDAIIRISAACVCGSDLWPYRGIQKIAQPIPMGHEYCGIVEEVGKCRQDGEARSICHWLLLRLGQYLSALSCRIPDVVPATRVRHHSPGTSAPRSSGRW